MSEENQVPDEQAQALAALTAAAEGPEIAAQEQEQEQEQQQAATLYESNLQALHMAFEMGTPLLVPFGFPTVAAVFNGGNVDQLCTVYAALATKHGWNLSVVSSKYKEEIAAGFVTWQIGTAVVAAVKVDTEAKLRTPEPVPEKQPKAIQNEDRQQSPKAVEIERLG